jgi:hypothetical protein
MAWINSSFLPKEVENENCNNDKLAAKGNVYVNAAMDANLGKGPKEEAKLRLRLRLRRAEKVEWAKP